MRHLPLDGLKIDSSFVRDACIDPRAAAITQSILALGENLGMRGIAEGVETEEELRFLRHAGCCAVQGYIFSKARPFNEIPSTLEQLARDWNDPFTRTDVSTIEVEALKEKDAKNQNDAVVSQLFERS